MRKLQDTANAFVANNLQASADRIIVVLLVLKRPKLRKDVTAHDLVRVRIRKNDDIWDFVKILRDINDLPTGRLKEVYDAAQSCNRPNYIIQFWTTFGWQWES